MRSTRTLTAHDDSVYDVAWSADGARLVSCGRDGMVVVWTRSGEVERVFGLAGPVVAVRSCDGDVVAATRSGTIATWSVATGDERWLTDVGSAETLAVAPGGEIVVGGADGRISVHDQSSGRELRRLATKTEDAVIFLCFSPDGRSLAVSTRGAGVELLEWPSGDQLRTVEFAPRDRCVVYACVFAPDSATCAAALHFRRGGAIGTTEDPDLYEIALWRPLKEELDGKATLLGHVSWMRGLAFSPGGDVLVSGGFDENVCVWDPEFHVLRAEAREHEGAVYAVAFSPDGASFATGSADRTVRLWDAAAVDEVPGLKPGPAVGSHEEMLTRLLSTVGTLGRNPLLVVAQDVADGLLRLDSMRDMEEAVDSVVEAAYSVKMMNLGRAVTQTLTVRGEQARRTQDEVLAFRCARLNALFQERIHAYFTRSIAERREEGGVTTPVEPGEESDAALKVVELLNAVVAGSVAPEEALSAIVQLRPTAGDLTLAAAQLHDLWPDVLAGRRARAPVAAASAIVAELVKGFDDDLPVLLANDLYGRLLGIGGDNPRAVAYLERAVEAARRWGDAEPLQAVLGNLANVYRNVGQLRDSRRAYEEAIALAKEGSHFEGQVNHLANLAIVESDLGNTAAQAELLRDARAIAVARKLTGSLALLSNNLATFHMDIDDYEGAAALCREAIAAAEETDDEAGRAVAVGTLAQALAALGDDARARELYEEALAGALELDNSGSAVHALSGLSRLAEKDGDLERAADFAAEAVTVADRAQLPPRLVRALAQLAHVRGRMGDGDSAIELLERAGAVGETLREEIVRSSEGPHIQDLLADVYDELVLRLADAGRVEEAFAAAERGRAALLLRRLQRGAPRRVATAEELAHELGRAAPNAVLVSYYLAGSELLLFVVRAGEPPVLERRSLSPGFVDKVVQDFAGEVGAGPDTIGETWLRLGQFAAEPLAPYLGDGSSLLLVPHRSLHNLPLHALRIGGARVVERWPVAYLPSASAFPYLVANGAAAAEPAVIGAHFTEEAEAVAAALGVETDLIGAEIDVEAALGVLARTDLVHVSAHGFFSRREPDLSGWILRPSDDLDRYLELRAKPTWQRTAPESESVEELADWADNSILSASDLAGRRVAATLVVASACESGVIAVDPADDPSGLVPALLGAGVRGVVATLWLIDAQRTRVAMLAFHDALAQSDGWDRVPRAVRQAALAVKETDPHPYYWAPYVAIGGFARGKDGT